MAPDNEPDNADRDGQAKHDDLRDLDLFIYNTSQMLLSTWLRREHNSAHKSSGVNCALMCIRTLYGHLTSLFADKNRSDIADFESKNPFMPFAWRDFRRVTRPAMEQLVHAVWKRPIEDIETTSLTFDEIFTSPEMCATLWSMDEGRPYRGVIWCPVDATQWLTLSDVTPPPNVAAFVDSVMKTAVPNLICLAARPNMDLGHEIGTRFKVFDVDDAQVTIAASPCHFIHVCFEVQNVSVGQALQFDDFRTFHLDIYDFEEDDGVDEWTLVDRIIYNLVALVRHRTSEEGMDTIRTYSLAGQCRKPNVKAGYANPTWKLEDFSNGDRFTGLFVQSCFPIAPRFPDLPFDEIQPDEDYLQEIRK